MSVNRSLTLERLDYYYQVINATILSKQNPASGLIPASVAVTSHGDYTDAWVRDNVYSIYCVYGLALSYKRLDDTTGRAFELEHAVVKLMRGLLFSMMRQTPKVETFKKTQDIIDALHAKYNTKTGDTVVKDNEWGHLQIDATSFFLVALADMTTSGYSIIYTQDEVDFVQNLVYYIERAYRTPDFGIWERGDKRNNGNPELNSSSIGMAYAALRAISGVNLFGARGGPSSTIYVFPDEMTRNKITLESILPRESNSKEVDGAVLSVIGFPAFAVEDPQLIKVTREDAKKKLEGRYGWKRFLRDGHQTVVEDNTRLHYNESELKVFENIESEWPLFFTYLVLEGLFTEDMDQAEEYRKKLAFVTIDSALWDPEHPRPPEDDTSLSERPRRTSLTATGLDLSATPDLHIPLVPELYYVPAESIEAERAEPHSQKRIPNDNTPLVWALSLYLLGNLMYENLLAPSELDPLGRRFNVKGEKTDSIVQVVLLSEDEALQRTLSTYGLETQTVNQISSSFTVLPPQALVEVYGALGRNEKLGTTGRPARPMGTLSTARLYRIEGNIYAFTPQFMDVDTFYLNSDPDYLVSTFETELSFTSKHWVFAGRPTLTVILTNTMLADINNEGEDQPLDHTDASKKNLLNFFMNLRSGECNGVRVRLSRLAETINTSNIESLDFLINKPNVDWNTILSSNKGYHRRTTRRHLGTETVSPGVTPGNRTPHRRKSIFGGKLLGTPLDELEMHHKGYFQEIANALERINQGVHTFKLKDHEVVSEPSSPPSLISSPDEEPATPLEETDMLLSLVLGDETQFDAAVKTLQTSTNLYDQIDLLQYLASCRPLDAFVTELDATIQNLLEEVYVKSKRLQYWSVARQASGLLCKTMPSLTNNLTDLVIRQKQVSIGSGQTEYLISSPLGPDVLGKMISEQCLDDVREGPVVQEIIISLGSFIRAQPNMFDGILRLRTHYIIIALREEISRVNHFNEEEAIEHLMQLSPFELQSLLGTVMSGPSMCEETTIMIRDKPGGYLILSQEFDPARRLSIEIPSLSLPPSKNEEDIVADEPTDLTEDTLDHYFPNSNGRWLRRRKNDGALNRVPKHFFPRTWTVLDKCEGFKMGEDHLLPRDPTVFDRTPEEFNFALAVESLLDAMKDPAERQIAVEILTLLYKVQTHHAAHFDMVIDIPAILDGAVSEFWDKWVSKVEKGLLPEGTAYETNKELARRLFYDLPLDDCTESTSLYIAHSIKHVLEIDFDYSF